MKKMLMVLCATAFMFGAPAYAQFSPGPNPITGPETAQRSLTGGTGTIDSTGSITIASGSTVPLLISGTSTLVNNGTIQTLGSGRAIDSNSGIANLTVSNNGLISAVSADAFRVNTNSVVSLINGGTIRVTAGGQAIDWAAITTASNTLTNLSTGIISAVGEDAVRPGVFGSVINYGTITATPTVGASVSGSDGIDLRVQEQVTVTNYGLISGRHGIATDGANVGPSSLTLTNGAGGRIEALNGSGVNIDGVSTSVVATITNAAGGSIIGGVLPGTFDADGDGIDVDGVLNLTNDGDVLGRGARGPNNAEGVAAGGGRIVNGATGRIIGDLGTGDPARGANGILIDDSNGGSAVAVTTIENHGLIEGRNGFGIKLVGAHDDFIYNNAGGVIRANNGVALDAGDGHDLVRTAGTIDSTSGIAIDLGAGSDSLIIDEGSTIVGNITGGDGIDYARIDAGSGSQFAYGGVLSDFERVQIASGHVIFAQQQTYVGRTQIDSASTLTLGSVLGLNALGSLDLAGGTLELAASSAPNTLELAGLVLFASSTIDLNGSSLTFGEFTYLGNYAQLSVIDWSQTDSPDYAIRFSGDLSADELFLALVDQTTINGFDTLFSYDGTYTNLVGAVPLPAGLWLLLSGLGLAGAMRRRSARAQP